VFEARRSFAVFDSCQNDPLVPKRRDELESTTERIDIPTKGRNQAIVKISSTFETRHVALIDERGFGEFRLGATNTLPQRAHGEANAALSAQASTENPNGLWLFDSNTLRCSLHGPPPPS
jgi:hypothetical protein